MPSSGNGYDSEDAKEGGTGYVPISLQYKEYVAKTARDPSIAGGDPLESFTNRSYKNKKSKAINSSDLEMVTDTYQKMNGKPVIVCVNLSNPSVFAEFEGQADAILVTFGVQDQAVLDILTGAANHRHSCPYKFLPTWKRWNPNGKMFPWTWIVTLIPREINMISGMA